MKDPLYKPKAIDRHCVTFYEALKAGSVDEMVNGRRVTIWRGGLLKLMLECGISQSYYTKLFARLEGATCIQRLNTGSGNLPSEVALLTHPNEVDWSRWSNPQGLSADEDRRQRIDRKVLDIAERCDKLEARLSAIESSLGGMDVVKAFEGIERRLTAKEL